MTEAKHKMSAFKNQINVIYDVEKSNWNSLFKKKAKENSVESEDGSSNSSSSSEEEVKEQVALQNGSEMEEQKFELNMQDGSKEGKDPA